VKGRRKTALKLKKAGVCKHSSWVEPRATRPNVSEIC